MPSFLLALSTHPPVLSISSATAQLTDLVAREKGSQYGYTFWLCVLFMALFSATTDERSRTELNPSYVGPAERLWP